MIVHTPTRYIGRTHKTYEEAYQQGAKDMEKAKQIIIDSLLKQIEQIRAETIDEFALKLVQWKPQNEEYMSFRDVVFQIAEQLKEQK